VAEKKDLQSSARRERWKDPRDDLHGESIPKAQLKKEKGGTKRVTLKHRFCAGRDMHHCRKLSPQKKGKKKRNQGEGKQKHP